MICMAIVGIGVMGKKYAKIIDSGKIRDMTLSVVCCRSTENQNWVKDNISDNVIVFNNIDEMFKQSSKFDAILIVTPHKEHCNIAIRAFEHNKHVFCDKPSGVYTKEVKQMNDVARNKNVSFAMMFHNRTFEIYQYVKQIIDNNELGNLKRILLENSRYFRTSHYHNSANWRSSWSGEGGGALINQGQHILDIWQWIFGMPKSLYAKIPFGKYNDFLVDDEVSMIMEYENDLTAVFIITTGEVLENERLEIIGTKGRIVINGNKLQYWKNNIEVNQYIKSAKVNSNEHISFEYNEICFENPENPYIIMLNNFVENILYNKPLIAGGKEGINALMLTNAAYLSAWIKKSVDIPIDENYYLELLKAKIDEEKL